MSSFYKAYRQINIFLLILGICPFLQSRRTQRFVCRQKYLVFVCSSTMAYFTYVAFLSFYRLPPLMANLYSMVRILKLCRTIGNAYALFFVISFLLIDRQAHANFFNKLYQFDCAYSKLVKPSINYITINRMFWIEIIVFACYLCVAFFTEVKFNENMKYWLNTMFWSCEVGEQMIYAFIVFHMKNCASNLITRFRQINVLLTKMEFSKESNKSIKAECCWQLEKIAQMLDILFKARDDLQQAFGSALMMIFVYNLFAVALSSYIMINVNIYESNQRTLRHLYYITVKYFGFEVPLILKDFYFTAYFHFLGNTVRVMETVTIS